MTHKDTVSTTAKKCPSSRSWHLFPDDEATKKWVEGGRFFATPAEINKVYCGGEEAGKYKSKKPTDKELIS